MSATAGPSRPKHCSECGTKIGEQDAYCGGCGGAIVGGGVPPATPQKDQGPVPKSTSRKPFWIAVLAVLVLGALGVFAISTISHDADDRSSLSKAEIDRMMLAPPANPMRTYKEIPWSGRGQDPNFPIK